MRKYLCSENGFVEVGQWTPHCWVDIESPGPDDIHFLRYDMNVPESFLESVQDMDERPRIEVDGEWRLTLLRIPYRLSGDEMPYSTAPIGIITNGEVIVTVCPCMTEMIQDFIDHTRVKGISINTEPDFVLRLIYSSAYWYLRYLKDISNKVFLDVHHLERNIKNEDLLTIMKLQRTLVFFNTSLRGNETLLGRIRRVYGNDYDSDLLEDVEIELRQADNTVKTYSDILESTMDSFASIISNNVNAIMKKMTAVSIVLMVPTLIASFYGMNVAIDYGSHAYVFWLIIAGSFLLSGILYLILRRIRWF